MGIWTFFTGKPPAEMAREGDRHFAAGDFGLAKLQYERALDKAARKASENQALMASLHLKIADVRQSLAKSHLTTGQALMESRNFAEAEDLLRLALELAATPDLKQDIRSALDRLPAAAPAGKRAASSSDPASPADGMDTEEAYFAVLCHALPEPVRDAYTGYGGTFRQGFVALNNGQFQAAAEKLSRALAEDPENRPLIALELATALVHLGQYDRASTLVGRYVEAYPEELRGYQMMCDIDWATGKYEDAMRRIESCPASLKASFPIQVLLGETCFQMGRYAEAKKIFQACQTAFGPDEMISRALAKTHEALGDITTARNIYSQILAGCARCGGRTDPFVKRRYAELCFASGERSSRVLELFLAVAQEDPDSRAECYRRVGDIYEALGNAAEARRYRDLS